MIEPTEKRIKFLELVLDVYPKFEISQTRFKERNDLRTNSEVAVRYDTSFQGVWNLVILTDSRERLSHSEQNGQVALAVRTGLFRWWNWSRSGWFDGGSHRRSSTTDWSTTTGTAGWRASAAARGSAVAIDDVISAQAKGLFGLTSHTTIAVSQGTGQGSHDFWAAAGVSTNLITNLISSGATNSFIGIVQTIDEGRHDFWIADAVISIAKLTQSSSSLTSIASGLRGIDQLRDVARIPIAASCFNDGSTGRRGSGSRTGRRSRSTASRSGRRAAVLGEQALQQTTTEAGLRTAA